MKHLKQKLMAATAMLMVSAVMMTTSTYAWFAISTAPEVTDITTTISASGSFEIALGTDETTEPEETGLGDAGDDSSWGATVTTVEGFSGIEFPMTTLPTSLSGFGTVQYDDSGRAYGDLAEITFETITYSGGIASVSADVYTSGVTTEDEATKETKVVASSVLLWLRTNTTVTDAKFALGEITIYDESDSKINTSVENYSGIKGSDIKVVVTIDGEIYETTETFALTANKATAVEVMIYLDGTNITNEILASGYKIVLESITFSSEAFDSVGTSS